MMITKHRPGSVRSALLLAGALAVLSCRAQTTAKFAVIGDYGWAGQPELDVSVLVRSWNPDFVVTVGDNNYEVGSATTIDQNIGQYYHDFIHPYFGTYGAGAATNRFWPSLGNHDWGNVVPNPGGADPYIAYFTLPGNERYYGLVRGPVHFFSIDSDQNEPDGTSSASTQALWLQSGLAASTSVWKIAFFHHAPYTSSTRGPSLWMRWPFQTWRATSVLTGHDHHYERIIRDGMLFFVCGLGGRSISTLGTPTTGSIVRYNGNYGAMLVEATNNDIRYRFFTRTGLLIDAYTQYMVRPSAYVINIGSPAGGGLSSLGFSDDDRLRVGGDELNPTGQLEMTATSPTLSAAELRFKYETGASRADISEVVHLYNYTTGTWELVHGQTCTLGDSGREFVVWTNASRFINPLSAEMKARMRWDPQSESSLVDGWSFRIDLANWQINP